MNTNELLSQVNWPSAYQDHKGTMTYTRSVGEDINTLSQGTVTTAAVLAHADKIQLRVRTTAPDGKSLFPIVDAEWVLSEDGQYATLQRFHYNERECPPNDTQAIEAFQDEVNLLGVKPQFQAFALRKPQVSKEPTVFKFDL